MKNVYKYALIASASLSLAACNNLIEPSETVDIERTITLIATREGTDSNTRSVRMEDGTTWWGPKEEISVFYGSGTNGGSKFTSNNTTLVETTEFEGSIAMSGNKEFWAVYPYSSENSCDGSSVVTVIPSQQTGSEGNFADDAFPAIGKSSSLTMPFWNICGGIKFFVSRSDIKSVTVKGNGGETLAGKVKVAFNADGKPEVTEVLEGKTEVTLEAPDGGSFKPGKYYYVTLLPTALDGGISLTFFTSSEKGEIVSDNAQKIKRSIFGVLKKVDSAVTEWESTVVEPEWVDLGMSVKWATYNVGATKPEEFGDYFAWGETEPKEDYLWSTYKFWVSGDDWDNVKFNKYCPSIQNSFWGGSGSPDNKTFLDSEDDAATANWGSDWRMPTNEEWTELRENCTWTWTDNYNETGIKGHEVISSNGTSIFLPAAGLRSGTNLSGVGSYGLYESSSLYTDLPNEMMGVYFSSDKVSRSINGRLYGSPVRPVTGDPIFVAGVNISPLTLTLIKDESATLSATVIPSTAKNKSVTWTSSDTNVATVDQNGNVAAVGKGIASITVSTVEGSKKASCEVIVKINLTKPDSAVAIDLGLPSGIKWATCNVGATKPEDYGEYFAWGETDPKYNYNLSTYKWFNDSYHLTKYCHSDKTDNWGGSGSPDNMTELEPEDDAARVHWGDSWRMPTHEDWTELRKYCTWAWASNYKGTGITGHIVTSDIPGYEDKSVFLPAAGIMDGGKLDSYGSIGFYWSSSLVADYPYSAWGIYSSSGYYNRYSCNRYCGFSVRPVSE